MNSPYWARCLIALDVFVNVLTGGLQDETISARVQRVTQANQHPRWYQLGIHLARAILAMLDFIQKHHGLYAEEDDEARAATIVQTEQQAIAKKPGT